MQRLELTWIGKDEQPQVEPRILLHDPSKDYGDPRRAIPYTNLTVEQSVILLSSSKMINPY